MSDKKKERINIHEYRAEFDDIPGTRVFTAQRARKGYWLNKFATSYDEGDGMGAFPFSEHTNVVMTARPEGIAITLTTADMEENERMRGVIERHIDRFAFREAPLTYDWTEQ